MKIYFIRHGETTGDVEDRYGGAYDDELTEKGRKQARELAGKMANLGIEILFCSPLKRARQTAEIIKDVIGCEIKIIDGLRERNKNGILTGMTKSEARAKYPILVEEVKDYRNQIEGAEGQADFENRIMKTFGEITGESDYSRIGIVTHGMPFWIIFANVLKDNRLEKVGDCGFMVLEKEGKIMRLVETANLAF